MQFCNIRNPLSNDPTKLDPNSQGEKFNDSAVIMKTSILKLSFCWEYPLGICPEVSCAATESTINVSSLSTANNQ